MLMSADNELSGIDQLPLDNWSINYKKEKVTLKKHVTFESQKPSNKEVAFTSFVTIPRIKKQGP